MAKNSVKLSKFVVDLGDERILSCGGLALVGELLEIYYTHNFRPKNKRFIVIAN